MRGPAPHTAEDATPRELFWGSVRLLMMLLVLALLVVPLLRELPLGTSGKTALLAWLLVGVAMYWLYAGLGYQPLLLLQLLLFSTAATLLITKVALVLVGIHRLSVLRRVATGLIIGGAALSVLNLGAMLGALLQRRAKKPPAP
ncbi:MAG: hypothetical protein ABI647_11155 [Gemmatimonadota bacterium]